ncbi:MAG: CoA ester lyase [Granulosicoccus sp.]|nr:CoA ester lyase [Granulosicoccus sp.]
MTIDCRSALYTPSLNERILAKGPRSEADAIIVDLEDSVAPESKDSARAKAFHALTELDYGHRLRALRINAADTRWHADDVAAVASIRPDAVVLPKVQSADDIQALSEALDRLPGTNGIAIWAMMESPLAVLNAQAIAQSVNHYPRLAAVLVGNNDLARESGMSIRSDRTFLLPWLMTLVAAARAYGLGILDGVYNDFADTAGFHLECEQGAAMGMDGKTLIHPSQIVAANDIFAPSADAIAHARAIVEAFALPENAQAGVVQIDGRMVERLHLGMARKLLARVEHLDSRT